VIGVDLELLPGHREAIRAEMSRRFAVKRKTQPFAVPNCGCIFKNPRGLSAGALIERAGLGGTRIGGAVVSGQHGNFLLAEPGTTAKDVLTLIDMIRERVAKVMNVELDTEIDIW